jgi:secreted trypsin-like serine protease
LARILVIGLFLALAAAPAARAIVNGAPASDEIFKARFSWAVALVDPGTGGVCTAQLIAPDWVLGAAHCASPGHWLLAGNSSRALARQVGIAEVIPHPKYDPKTGDYDLALVRLTEPLAYPPLRVATPTESERLLQPGAKAVIAGWGRRSARADYSDRLVVSDVELRGLERQGTRFGYSDPVSGPCGGDSGGPLLRQREDGTDVLLGVASRTGGDLCATGGGVGIYVEVALMREFIAARVKHLP